MLNILASFAEFEREMIAGRIAESRARLKARGLRIAGAIPFGFETDQRTKQLLPKEEEACIVRWMFERAAKGETPAAIAEAANALGYRTKLQTGRRSGKQHGGNIWTARQVISTVRNPVYTGQFWDKGGARFGRHQSIVSSELFEDAAAQLLARRTRTPGKRYEIDWPLKGRIECARCSRPMTPHTIRHGNVIYRYYRCRSTAGGRAPCGRQVSAPAIENAVVENIAPRLSIHGQEAPIWDSIERVVYHYRTDGIRVSVTLPVQPEKETGSGNSPVSPVAES